MRSWPEISMPGRSLTPSFTLVGMGTPYVDVLARSRSSIVLTPYSPVLITHANMSSIDVEGSQVARSALLMKSDMLSSLNPRA